MQESSQHNRSVNYLIIAVVAISIMFYLYQTVRSNDMSVDTDTATFSNIISQAQQAQSVVNAPKSYSNGMGYTAFSLFLVEISGISVDQLQTNGYVVIIPFVALAAFIAYRELLGNSLMAVVATLVIHLQPDFLFVIRRGSHEKFTWIIVYVMLFLIAKGFRERKSIRNYSRYIFVFYPIAFTLITINIFFASTFITMMLLSFIGGAILVFARYRVKRYTSETVKMEVSRLLYIAVACSLLFYLFLFHLYPPAESFFHFLGTLGGRMQAVFLTTQVVAVNPYSYVTRVWLFPSLYILLTMFSWITLVGSFVIWLVRTITYFRRRTLPDNDLGLLLMWLLYGTLGLQMVSALMVDVSDVVNNIQVRLFVPLMLVAAPILVYGFFQLIHMPRLARVRKTILRIASVLVFFAAIGALLKSTNDPLINSNWIFGSRPEIAAVIWTSNHATNSAVYAGMDTRLASLGVTYGTSLDPSSTVEFYGFSPNRTDTRYYLFSDIEVTRWERWEHPMFYLYSDNLVYDNGSAILYQIRPATKYQN